MKYLLLGMVLACSVASADELVVNIDGTQTFYRGRVQALYVEGVTGEVVFEAGEAPSVGQWTGTTPTATGLWHVSSRPGVKKGIYNAEGYGNCYGTVAFVADHPARIVLTCSTWSID